MDEYFEYSTRACLKGSPENCLSVSMLIANFDIERAKPLLERGCYQEKSDNCLTLALHFDSQKNYDIAEKLYKKTLELESKSNAVNNLYGAFLRRQHRYKEAEDILTHAIKENENNRYGYVELFNIYMAQKSYVKAEQLAIKSFERFPDFLAEYNMLGRVVKKTGNYKFIEFMLQKSLNKTPNGFGANYELGIILFNTKRYNEGVVL